MRLWIWEPELIEAEKELQKRYKNAVNDPVAEKIVKIFSRKYKVKDGEFASKEQFFEAVNVVESAETDKFFDIDNDDEYSYIKRIPTTWVADYIGKTDALQDSLKNAMLNNLWMFVYSGHGYPGGLGNPLSLSVNNNNEYVYSNIPPITLSFACSTNAKDNNNNMFGRSWITERGKGGLIHYGATNTSFTDSNEYLAVNIFNRLSKTNNVVGRWLQSGAGHYYSSFMSPRRRRQVEKYNIFGDPSQYIFGTPSRYVLMSPEYKENLSLEFVDNQII